jgi:two-component system nitrogen regulation sensor histidine kinase NtrY
LVFATVRPAVRAALRRNLSSYSKRLIAVYTLLLVVPLLLLNLVLIQGLSERMATQQRSGGEAALRATERILGDYLPSLRPGFSVATAIDDSLLSWLSQVVRHEVNLYWRGEVSASSKPELFAAGLMPRRIPGEVYSRLTLRGASLASRTNQVGRDNTYLELYAPLSLPGEPAGRGTLFLSVPLLAQQEELAAELLELSRQALLITTALFLLLVAVGGRLARSFTTPLMQIVRGTGRIAAGETSLHLEPNEPELAALVAAIDDMAQRIAEARGRLLREKQVIEGMVENITAGVVSLDRERRVLMRNRVAAELLGLEVGDPVERAVRSSELAPLAEFLAGVDGGPHRTTATLRAEDGSEHEWTLVWVPVPGDGSPSALLVVEDVTEVLRGQRLAAWAEMARIIAHEIKNPLTPIRLSAEHLRRVYVTQPDRFDEVFERCTSNILAQVDELQLIASEFSAYSHIPRIDPRPGDLAETVARVTEGYRTSPPPGVAMRFAAAPETVPVRHDARLLGRAVRNLVENAVRASGTRGEVDVRVEADGDTATIAVADRGPGVPPEHLRRIFDPYFSTSSGGTGLGLPIARRIAEEHGGSIEAHNREGGGLEVAITIPKR